jgi:hypothetical protein
MIKHVYFWVGLFFALIVILPLFYGIAFFAERRALDVAILLFGGIVFVLVILLFALFFRRKIIKKITGRGEASYSEVYQSGSQLARAIIARDANGVDTHLHQLTSTLFAWYSWTFFYRWVLGFAVALLLAFGGFAGTVLLFEQNRKMDVQNEKSEFQNELMALDLKEQIRNLLLLPPITLQEFLTDFPIGGATKQFSDTKVRFESCEITAKWDARLYRTPNESDILHATDLVNRELLKGRSILILNNLMKDENLSVSYGAITVLDRIGELKVDGPMTFEKMIFKNIELPKGQEIFIAESVLENVECNGCKLGVSGSFVGSLGQQSESGTKLMYAIHNIIYGNFSDLLFGAAEAQRASSETNPQLRNILSRYYSHVGSNLHVADFISEFDEVFFDSDYQLMFDADNIGQESSGQLNYYNLSKPSYTQSDRDCMELRNLCDMNDLLMCRDLK